MIKPNLDQALAVAREHQLAFEHRPEAYAIPVVSCVEAAKARGVQLEQELKHLLVQTCKGMLLVHLPANKKICFAWLKRKLGVRQAHLADLSVISANAPYVRPGTVSVFVEPFWSLPHLMDDEIFEMEKMTTNDGTLHGYVLFDPNILRHVREGMIESVGNQAGKQDPTATDLKGEKANV